MRDLNRAGAGAVTEETDVCIIGAGVAGQTVAKRLAALGVSVVLTESGSRKFDNKVQSLAGGAVLGEQYYDLQDSRLRLFGGTTAIWGGRCVALDRIDFEKRDWVDHSGWPVSYDELDPYVDEAFRELDLLRPRSWNDISHPRPPFDPEHIDAAIWSFDHRGERFTSTRSFRHPRITLWLNATMVSMRASDGGEVTSAEFTAFSGAKLTVKARRYVLAAGGIENPRLLLACCPDRPAGLGNDNDLVGRFFMEHPHGRGGAITPAENSQAGWSRLFDIANRTIFHKGRRYAAAFRPSEKAQRERRVLNTAVSLVTCRAPGASMPATMAMINGLKHNLPATKLLRSTYRRGKELWVRYRPDRRSSSAAKSLMKTGGRIGLYAIIRAEQAPNPASRVRLTDEKDALGVPRAGLDWRFSEIDGRSALETMTLLDQELRRTGAGSADPSPWLKEGKTLWEFDPLVSFHPIGGYHHMGTTRMAETPDEGVTDGNCRVFGVNNLYIAGSSLFPTAGWANPTVSIMALATRLADHLAEHQPK